MCRFSRRVERPGSSVFAAFAVPDPEADRERCIRVIGASVAVGFLALTAHESGDPAAWRPHIVATAVDALGFRRSTPLTDPSQREA